MERTVIHSRTVLPVAILGFLAPLVQAGQTCTGTTPRVCVERSDITPDIGTDVTFDFTDSSYPDVTFKTGHSTNPWRVWSQVSATDATPAHLGDLFIDSTSSTDNYKIELRNPNNGNPGCVNLKSAVRRDARSV